jgi:hypothetical protein
VLLLLLLLLHGTYDHEGCCSWGWCCAQLLLLPAKPWHFQGCDQHVMVRGLRLLLLQLEPLLLLLLVAQLYRLRMVCA